MIPYARILAGVDGSIHAEHALRHAVELAKACGAALRIVHVADMGWLPVGPELGLDVDRLVAARRADGEKLLAEAVELARQAGVAVEARLVETATLAQPAAAALVEEAASWPADVVVLGTRGRSGLERLLLGSVVDGVARRSTIPVVLVP
jgi:nucleotide-binding universal stress UspA family protein